MALISTFAALLSAAVVVALPTPSSNGTGKAWSSIKCSGCGCKGGPGWRVHKSGRCASYKSLAKECGNPPKPALCTFEKGVEEGINRTLDGTAQPFLSTPTSSADVLKGRASVIDADTIEIHGERVRINGIDAPEGMQTCDDATCKPYRCGQIGSNALDEFLSRSQPVSCSFVERDRYGRFVGICNTASGIDVASWLVRNGHAVDWARYSKGKYSAEQRDAKQRKAGIWQGKFIEPWIWRAQQGE